MSIIRMRSGRCAWKKRNTWCSRAASRSRTWVTIAGFESGPIPFVIHPSTDKTMQLSEKARKAIQSAASKYGIPESYLIAIAMIESQGNPKAVNRATGAKGLFQFLPSTALELGLRDPLDEVTSADAAARYTRHNLDTLRA